MNTKHWNERYAGTGRLFTQSPDETLVELAADLPPGRALDIGAGEGRNSLWLARRGWSVTAIDVSDVALSRLVDQAHEEHLPIATRAVDMNEFLAGEAEFELVLIANVHPEPKEREELFARASEALAPGGHVFVVGHDISCLGKAGPPVPERLFTEEMLKTAFPTLQLLRVEKRDSRHGDRGRPVSDVFVWAARPAESAVTEDEAR